MLIVLRDPTFGIFVCGPLQSFVVNVCTLHGVFWGRRSFIDPICCNFCKVLSMFLTLVLANPLFSLRDINFTLGLLPARRHVVWRDSVGVEGSRLGLKSECADIFHQSLPGCYATLTSPKKAETAVYGYNPALFEFFRCRVDALQS